MTNIVKLLKTNISKYRSSWLIVILLFIGFFISSFYKCNRSFYNNRKANDTKPVCTMDKYARYGNTALQVAIPIIMQDKIGIIQSIYVGISTTILTHGFKHFYNAIHLEDSIRPNQKKSNMPSGHSSMASCAMTFVCRRYGIKYIVIMLPITMITMLCRFELNCHTISACIAGLIIGVICGYCFSSKKSSQL
ncbi:phosphatase PAP2 family protein [Candidatus Deianiraea vastatrix]|uniref:LpxE-like lipid A 1-phosphatase n=1 Tax=Candidatus Deianiraea vastatrix TaxID=2163644 RepID=A0A5B8XFS9_9RICK|nr:phosphatase PAP2 family protein [Candidatus Deianiraea vastatrix]QED23755.1 LpxE-like lipid A 1-phosphatase [Candidatus Deianiraea vastatrix]